MIVKNNLIIQDFPAFNRMKEMTSFPLSAGVFLDIETTGLSSRNDFIYLIGAMDFSENSFILHQWTAQFPEEEQDILSTFSDYLKNCTGLLHFNGTQFDLPFLEARYHRHHLVSPLSALPSFDLCKELKKLQLFLKLPNRKFSTAEDFLGLTRKKDCNGKECIRLYQKYYATGREEYLTPILEHNQKDLQHLPLLCSLLIYEEILDGGYVLEQIFREDGGLTVHLVLDAPVPRLISYSSENIYLTAKENLLKIRLTPTAGKLRKYYTAYRDYYYLPEEDTAIHKSVGIYVDKSRRKAATPKTCYTWFPVTKEFLTDRETAETYLKENLSFLLGFFPK